MKSLPAMNLHWLLTDNFYLIYGFYFRMVTMAIAHFNHNVNREVKRRSDGTARVTVTYPKFKNGDATVKEVKVMQNFGMCPIVIFCHCL